MGSKTMGVGNQGQHNIFDWQEIRKLKGGGINRIMAKRVKI